MVGQWDYSQQQQTNIELQRIADAIENDTSSRRLKQYLSEDEARRKESQQQWSGFRVTSPQPTTLTPLALSAQSQEPTIPAEAYLFAAQLETNRLLRDIKDNTRPQPVESSSWSIDTGWIVLGGFAVLALAAIASVISVFKEAIQAKGHSTPSSQSHQPMPEPLPLDQQSPASLPPDDRQERHSSQP